MIYAGFERMAFAVPEEWIMMCAPPTKTYLFDVIGDLLQDTQEALLKLASARNRKPAQGRDAGGRVLACHRSDPNGSDPVLRYLRLWTRRSTWDRRGALSGLARPPPKI
jgi:hypothetical protein